MFKNQFNIHAETILHLYVNDNYFDLFLEYLYEVDPVSTFVSDIEYIHKTIKIILLSFIDKNITDSVIVNVYMKDEISKSFIMKSLKITVKEVIPSDKSIYSKAFEYQVQEKVVKQTLKYVKRLEKDIRVFDDLYVK
jgi:hypothetical protein